MGDPLPFFSIASLRFDCQKEERGTIEIGAIDEANYYDEVRKLIGCTCLGYAWLDNDVVVYYDDDGLTDGLEACTKVNL